VVAGGEVVTFADGVAACQKDRGRLAEEKRFPEMIPINAQMDAWSGKDG
jgi:hypothetical protein